MVEGAIGLINSLGYAGLVIGLILGSAGILIPSEILIAFSAVSAKQGKMSLAAIIILAPLAETTGAGIAYWIGKRGGIPLIHRYGKYFLLSNSDLDLTRRLFSRYGQLLAFIGQCLPVVRGYIGFVGGIAEMPVKRFLAATFLGGLAWTLFLVWLGYLLADNLTQIEDTIRPFAILIVGLVIVAFGALIWHRIRDNRKTD